MPAGCEPAVQTTAAARNGSKPSQSEWGAAITNKLADKFRCWGAAAAAYAGSNQLLQGHCILHNAHATCRNALLQPAAAPPALLCPYLPAHRQNLHPSRPCHHQQQQTSQPAHQQQQHCHLPAAWHARGCQCRCCCSSAALPLQPAQQQQQEHLLLGLLLLLGLVQQKGWELVPHPPEQQMMLPGYS